MKRGIIFVAAVAVAAVTVRADDIPCTKDGFYYAVCPTQPELSNKRVVDGSQLVPLPPDLPADVVDGSKLSTTATVHVAAPSSKHTTTSSASAASAVQATAFTRKSWRNYTLTDWMSIASIFLLALVVGVVFYLVYRAIQNERSSRTALDDVVTAAGHTAVPVLDEHIQQHG